MNSKFKQVVLTVGLVLTLSHCERVRDPNSTGAGNDNQAPSNIDTTARETTEPNNNPSDQANGNAPLAANSLPAGLNSEQILSRIHHTNQMEIELGKLAMQKGSADTVKSFGETLQKDHTTADQKVVSVAKKENVTLKTPLALNEVEKQKMSEHDSLRAKLSALSGEEFDKEFIQGMKQGHADVIAMLEANQSASESVKNLISDLLPTLRKHERTAQAIEQQLKITK